MNDHTNAAIEDLLRRALRHVRDGILITDAHLGPGGQRIVYANPAMAELTGYDVDQIVGRTPRMFQGPNTDRDELDRIRAALERAEPVRAELVNYSKDGRAYLIELDIAPLHDGAELTHFVAVQRDITAGKGREEMLERSHEFHRRLADLVREALDTTVDASFLQRILTDAVELVPGAQAGSLKLLGDDGMVHFVAIEGFAETLLDVSFPAEYILGDFPGKSVTVKRGFEPSPGMDPVTEAALYGEAGRASEIRASLGVPMWIGGRLRGLLNLDNFESEEAFAETAVTMGLLFGRLLERVERQIELSHQLRTDAVTGLPIRHYGEAILARMLQHVNGAAGGFLLLDLDDFKRVNDAFGHGVGDLVMREAAERIRSVVGGQGHVTRWSGDEFMILLPELTRHRPLASIARAVLEAVERPFEVGEQEITITASLGVVELPEHAGDAGEAIQHALIAVHRAQANSRSAFVTYHPEMRNMIAHRVRLERDLRAAINTGAIHLHYQPRVDLANDEIVALEALARWDHPELGAVSPDEFIALAEETGLIGQLGERVLLAACRQARAWLDAGRRVRVAVNVSAAELQREEFALVVEHTLERCGLPAELLELEITESTAMTDVRTTIEILRRIRDLGVTLTIDDFGTAYSSLNYLRKLPVAALKIDRSFVMDLSDGIDDAADEAVLVRSVVALAKSLRLRVVAEGVETEAQLRFLRELACDEAQGYHLGRPAPADTIDFGGPRGAPEARGD